MDKKEALLLAIDRAEGAGQCSYLRIESGMDMSDPEVKYAEPAAPACVIAQLYVIRGGDIEDLRGVSQNIWAILSQHPYGSGEAALQQKAVQVLEGYDVFFLRTIQQEWDADFLGPDRRKSRMRALVEKRYAVDQVRALVEKQYAPAFTKRRTLAFATANVLVVGFLSAVAAIGFVTLVVRTVLSAF